MFSFRRRFLSIFLISLILCCGLSYGRTQARELFTGKPTHLLQTGQKDGQQAAAGSSSLSADAPSTVDEWVQRGVTRYKAGDYRAAIALWKTALTHYQNAKNQVNIAIVLENLARAYQHLGQSELAIAYWERGVAIYRELGNLSQVARLLTEQAQVYSSIGQPKKAIVLLCQPDQKQTCTRGSALQLAQENHDSAIEVAALGSLGDAYRLTGNYMEAIAVLERSRDLAQTINYPGYTIAALNSLGNAYSSRAQGKYRRANATRQFGDCDQLARQGQADLSSTCIHAEKLKQEALRDDQTALQLFQSSQDLAQTRKDTSGELRSLLSAIPLHYRTGTSATAALQQATRLLKSLPASREQVYAAIDLAHLQQPPATADLGSKSRCWLSSTPQVEQLLKQAVTVAQGIQDYRAASFALGELGHLYECRKNDALALTFTQQARWAADQELLSKDSLYLWEWQTGRILKAQWERTQEQTTKNAAIAAYDRAIATLESIRGDILTATRDLQFDFRDTVDPLYREAVALRLSSATPTAATHSSDGSQKLKAAVTAPQASSATSTQADNLSAVLTTMDSLKLAELQNYFGNDCVLTAIAGNPTSTAARAATAVFSSIILDQQTAIVLTLPDGSKHFYPVAIDSQTLRQEVNEFRKGLQAYYDPFDLARSQKLYHLLMQPLVQDLEAAGIKTLVFVQDGILRTVPMAALHDGQQFLIEKYAIATTPSLSLTNPQPSNRQNLRALAVGLTKAVTVDDRQFPALENVKTEIARVKAEMPDSKPLLDAEFTRDRLQQELSQQTYPIIHIATHGEFGTDPEDTFLVTGDDKKLTINDLEATIRNTVQGSRTVDLLTLTACQTAVGDDRSALGLAGVAIQAGVGSALASLWFIDDATTAQIASQFYAGLLNPNLTKAEALQAAQKALIQAGGEYARPAYWAPFVLVGNWL